MEKKNSVQYVEMAYVRVSTQKQSLERQEASILEAVPNLTAKYFYKDKYTGKSFERSEYKRMKEKIIELKEANPSTDIRVTIHELDRIVRDYRKLPFLHRDEMVKSKDLMYNTEYENSRV